MKNRKLLITAVVFFLIVNTSYFWESEAGAWAFPLFILLAVIYVILAVILFQQIYFSIKGKFSDKRRNWGLVIPAIVLSLIFYKPGGNINFDELEGENLLVAGMEGSANCMITLKLKDNATFRSENACFGIEVEKGDYHLQGDTIYFENVVLGGQSSSFYKLAVMQQELPGLGKGPWLNCYKNASDSECRVLRITKNELEKFDASATRRNR